MFRGCTEVNGMRMVCLSLQRHTDALVHISKLAVLAQYLVQSQGPLGLTSQLPNAQNLCVALLVVLIRDLWVILELGKLREPEHKRGHTHCAHVPSPSFIHSVNLLEPLSYSMYYTNVRVVPDPCPQGTHAETCKYVRAI